MTPLMEWIRDKLRTKPNKRVPFAQFMAWALYHPTLGYYRRAVPKIGKAGDFYTSSHVHPLFGEMVAAFLCRLTQVFSGREWSIVEFGGGDGTLASHILSAMQCEPAYDTLSAYYLVEESPFHRRLAQRKLKHQPAVVWVDGLECCPTDQPLIVLSNELIDAMPIHRLRFTDREWAEIYVHWNERRGKFEEVVGERSSPELTRYVWEECPPEEVGRTIEVNLAAYRWLEDVATVMESGYILTIDYGYLRDELWSPERYNGTLMCYYRHRAHTNPYIRVGEQDMTSHVNFSSLQRWGEGFGLRNVSFGTQAEFLKEAGIMEKLQAHQDPDPFSAVARRNRAIRQLATASGMGDTFKVLLQEKK